MDYDAAWKRLFALPAMVEHLLTGFAGPVAGHLDFSTLRQLSASWVGADRRQRHGDAAWRVDYGDGSGRSLVVLLEFQSGVDPSMARRVRRYAEMARDGLRRQGELDADGKARVLPVVVYSGRPPWGASDDVPEVGVTAKGEASLPVAGAYLLLDAGRLGREDLPERNAAAAALWLNASRSPEEVLARLRALSCRVESGPLRALVEWLLAVWPGLFPGADAAALAEALRREFLAEEETTMTALAERIREWEAEFLRKGVAQGLERGVAAERELLRLQASRKFGADVADALAGRLAGMSDPARLAEVGERIIDCATGADLLDRLEAD